MSCDVPISDQQDRGETNKPSNIGLLAMITLLSFIGVVAVMFATNGVTSLPVDLAKKSSNDCGKSVVCNCNFHANGHAGESGVVIAEIKELKTKMEHLIAIVNTTTLLKPLPTTPGKIIQSYLVITIAVSDHEFLLYFTLKEFLFLRARNNTIKTSKNI